MTRVLIVDDEASIRRLLRTILDAEGYQTTEAGGVQEARKALASREVDVVITDQQMPDGSGLDVLAASREADPAVPVIFLTGVAGRPGGRRDAVGRIRLSLEAFRPRAGSGRRPPGRRALDPVPGK